MVTWFDAMDVEQTGINSEFLNFVETLSLELKQPVDVTTTESPVTLSPSTGDNDTEVATVEGLVVNGEHAEQVDSDGGEQVVDNGAEANDETNDENKEDTNVEDETNLNDDTNVNNDTINEKGSIVEKDTIVKDIIDLDDDTTTNMDDTNNKDNTNNNVATNINNKDDANPIDNTPTIDDGIVEQTTQSVTPLSKVSEWVAQTMFADATTAGALNGRQPSDEDQMLNDLLDQVAELDDIYEDHQLRRGSNAAAYVADELNGLEGCLHSATGQDDGGDFDDAATYSSLQIAFKNPISIINTPLLRNGDTQFGGPLPCQSGRTADCCWPTRGTAGAIAADRQRR